MNIFAGIGRIGDVSSNGKVLKFTLSVIQEKPCNVPCVVFDQRDEGLKFLQNLQEAKRHVWLQGRISSYEYQFNDKIVRKIEVVSHPRYIKPI